MKYHIKNQISKKAIKKISNHPLPTLLMAHITDKELNEPKTNRTNTDGIRMDSYGNQVIKRPES
jgi:hypothetical protein